MKFVHALGTGLRAASRYSPTGWARTRWQRRQFVKARAAHLFRGVFGSFAEAVASAPKTAPLSYDNPVSARMYLERLFVDDFDYPALFWLGESLREGMRSIVDVGGAVGIKYFAFENHLRYPEDLRWTVVDVPAVVVEGRRFAAERGVGERLGFSADLAVADGVDVFYASGALQYLDRSLPEILATYQRGPRRLLINTTPIHDRHAFFTLNSIGTAYCGYRVEARQAFIQGIEAQGYRLRAHWKNVGKKMQIIGRPEYSLDDYSGFVFDRID
ncbi:MAG: methyltransferase, TIGR04325 family [Lautropia sp.]|nr:methyltransferase, TIGR04325 family [Lautropia sp.]